MTEAVTSARGRGLVLVALVLLAGVLVLASVAAGHVAPVLHAAPERISWYFGEMALACLIGAAAAALGAPAAGFFATVLMLGGIAQLSLTQPDWFSNFSMVPRNHADRLMLLVLAGEALVVGVALPGMVGRGGLSLAGRVFGPGRLLALLALLTLSGVSLFQAILTHKLKLYPVKLGIQAVLVAVHFGAIVAFAAAADLPVLVERLRNGWWQRRPALGFALLALVIAALVSRFVFQGLGVVEDETAYLFQAKTFAAGHLMAPPLPGGLGGVFDYYLIDANARGWFATTAPGWPAVLALGVMAGAHWLVNPLLGALAVFLAHRLVVRLADRWAADVTALLMATSPWMIGSAASLMTHALSEVLIVGGWLAVVVARDRFADGRRAAAAGLALLAGLLMGWLFVTRALEGVIIGTLTGLWLMWALRARGWLAVGLYGLGCLATGALLLAYNAAITGDPLTMPLASYLDRVWGPGRNAFGFGPDIGPPTRWNGLDLWRGHSPLEGLINTFSALPPLDLVFLGWPVGSLLPLWAFVLWGRWRGLAQAMAVVTLAVVGVHLCYWPHAVFYLGPRYWYAASLPLLVLSALGIRAVIARLEAGGVDRAGERVVASVVLLSIFAGAFFTTWRGVEKYARRVAVSHAVEQWIAAADAGNAVVFLKPKLFDEAAILIDPIRRAGMPVIAKDLGAESNARVLAAFPGRVALMPDCRLSAAAPVLLRPLCPLEEPRREPGGWRPD